MKNFLWTAALGVAAIMTSEAIAQNMGQQKATTLTIPSPHKNVYSHKHHTYKHPYYHIHHHYHYYGEPPREVRLVYPEYYDAYPYLYHGGYGWHPHVRGNMLQRYVPHAVYGYSLPLRSTSMDAALYDMQTHPMQKKWESAPDKKHMME